MALDSPASPTLRGTSSGTPSSMQASASATAVPSNQDIEAVIQMATSSRPSVAPARDTRTQLFVGNLPYRVRWQDLKDLFRKAGTVLRADVSLGPDNRSRGYGTVLLGTAEDADMFNGYSWQTRILEVRADRMPPEYDINCPFPPATANNSNTSNVVLPMSNSGSQIHTPLGISPFPPLVPPSLSQGSSFTLDPGLRLSSSAAALSNSSLSNVLSAADLLPNGAGLSASTSGMSISRSASRNGMYDPNGSVGGGSKSIFVGNCQWQDLKDLFRRVGPVVRADVALGPDGRSRGFGTVLFQTEGDADKAVTLFHGYEYNNRALKVHHDKFTQIPSSSSPPFAVTMPLPLPLPSHSHSHSYSQYYMASAGGGGGAMVPGHMHPMQMMAYPFQSQPSSPFDQYPPAIPRHLMEQYMSMSGASGMNQGSSLGSGSGPVTGSGGGSFARGQQSVNALDPAFSIGNDHHHHHHHHHHASQSQNSNRSDGATSASSDISPTSNAATQTRPSSSSSPSTTTTSPQKENTDSNSSNNNATSTTPKTPTTISPLRSPPGTIAIPPPTGFIAQGVMFSPLGRGLPPMTPSMPGFQFHPQVSSTPPAFLPHFLSPGLGPNSPPPNMTFFQAARGGGGGGTPGGASSFQMMYQAMQSPPPPPHQSGQYGGGVQHPMTPGHHIVLTPGPRMSMSGGMMSGGAGGTWVPMPVTPDQYAIKVGPFLSPPATTAPPVGSREGVELGGVTEGSQDYFPAVPPFLPQSAVVEPGEYFPTVSSSSSSAAGGDDMRTTTSGPGSDAGTTTSATAVDSGEEHQPSSASAASPNGGGLMPSMMRLSSDPIVRTKLEGLALDDEERKASLVNEIAAASVGTKKSGSSPANAGTNAKWMSQKARFNPPGGLDSQHPSSAVALNTRTTTNTKTTKRTTPPPPSSSKGQKDRKFPTAAMILPPMATKPTKSDLEFELDNPGLFALPSPGLGRRASWAEPAARRPSAAELAGGGGGGGTQQAHHAGAGGQQLYPHEADSR
ncbi:hypothetical protein FRB98_001572 [Tulasnella sp. 332]|nr:hypothetical protein FRB98_001572 [Tulasnella sp. 332]